MKKHTKGKLGYKPVKVHDTGVFRSVIITSVGVNPLVGHVYGRNTEHCEANAQLFTEAFNVTNDTGLTPLELKEQNDKMRELLKEANKKIEIVINRTSTGYNRRLLTEVNIGILESLTPSKGQN